jgi:hypothetical protein
VKNDASGTKEASFKITLTKTKKLTSSDKPGKRTHQNFKT